MVYALGFSEKRGCGARGIVCTVGSVHYRVGTCIGCPRRSRALTIGLRKVRSVVVGPSIGSLRCPNSKSRPPLRLPSTKPCVPCRRGWCLGSGSNDGMSLIAKLQSVHSTCSNRLLLSSSSSYLASPLPPCQSCPTFAHLAGLPINQELPTTHQTDL